MQSTKSDFQVTRQDFGLGGEAPVRVQFSFLGDYATEMTDHLGPVIDVVIEGQTFHFLLDTGAPTTLLRRSRVKNMKVQEVPQEQYDEKLKRLPTLDNRMYALTVDRLQVGKANFAGLIYVIDDQKLDKIKAPKIDGILGCDKLLQKLVYLNFGRQELVFYPLSRERSSLLKELDFQVGNSREIITYGQSVGRIFVETALNDQVSEIAILDTGGGGSLIVTPGLNVKPQGKQKIGSLDGVDTSQVANITVGLQGYSVALSEVYLQPEGYDTVLLGMDFLRHFELLIDQKKSRIYLKPTDSEVVVGPNLPTRLPAPSAIPIQRDIPYWTERVSLLYYMERYSAALETLSRIEKFTVNDGMAWAMRGYSLWQIEKRAEAASALKRATALLPDDVGVCLNYGMLLIQLKRNPEALAAFQSVLKRSPGLAVAEANLGVVLVELGRIPEALPLLEKAVQNFPEDVSAQLYLGACLVALGKSAASLIPIDKVLRKDSDNLFALLYRGQALYDLDRDTEAKDTFEKATKIKPESAYAWTGLGKSLSAIKENQKAVEALNKSIQLDANNINGFYYRGYAHYKLGNYKMSYDDFKKYIELNPKKSEAWEWEHYSKSAYYINKFEESVMAGEKATKLDPKNASAWYYLGLARLKLGKKKEASDAFDKATTLDPKFRAPKN
ncbi:tetratricopeptide repeat protein [Armatimonas sp.]|uniref:tetratricopeptide repeat protein n=1 Tax=Armatimonas sp. TaxID=1872638 RepID=UPI00286A3E01|nr:tetratricopeptide repeat protein [Armatimonas sp.]